MVPKVKTYNSAKAIKKAKRQMAGLKQRYGKTQMVWFQE